MRPYALRLAVALLTFFVGVTLAALWYTNRSQNDYRLVMTTAPTAVIGVRVEPPPPPVVTVTAPTALEGGIINGKAVSKPMPVYPPIAKAAHAEGTVVVRVLVDESGRVESAAVVSGHPLLQQAAVAAARMARFSPTLLSGRPVKVSGTVTYNFVLE